MSQDNVKIKYHLLDALRALFILQMVLFHFLYDFNEIYGQQRGWYQKDSTFIWQQSICMGFIFLSGFCFHFSRNSIKRSFVLNGWGLVITVVTLVAMPYQPVIFGILNFLGCATLLTALGKPILHKIPATLGALVSLLLFIITRQIGQGYIGIYPVTLNLPEFLYEHEIFTPFGFPYAGFRSSDFFPIFPWIFLFLMGYFFHPMIMRKEGLQNLCKTKVPILSRIGTLSIWIYLLHQPIAMLICHLIFTKFT